MPAQITPNRRGAPGTVIGNAIVSELNGPDLVAAHAAANLVAPLLVVPLVLLVALLLLQSRQQYLHRDLPVMVLRTTAVDPDLQSGGPVRQHDARGGLVAMLTTSARAAHENLFQIPRIDLD